MSGWSLARIADLCGGRLEHEPAGDVTCPYGAIGIDTRTIEAGSLFVAVRAARDGHAYLASAQKRGAIAALVDTRPDLDAPQGFPLIRVSDTIAALHRWAAAHREAMQAEAIIVTGSSGKTTTKDLIAAVLAADRPIHRTTGNLNNQLGVPITLLGLRPDHRWAVIEVATNHPGEIAPLARICRPDHVVLTSIGWAHIGAFGSREAILSEKLHALDGLDAKGLFFHDADPWITAHLPESVRSRRRLTFGLDDEADCHPERPAMTCFETRFTTPHCGEVVYRCPGPGALRSALAAILVAKSLGVSGETVRGVIARATPRTLRMEPRRLGGATALLDCYNASPESSLAAIDFLLQVPCEGSRWLLFGEMRELGANSEAAHRQVGKQASGVDGAFFLGSGCEPALAAFRGSGGKGLARLYDRHEEMARDLLDHLGDRDLVLFKGARAMEMEKVFELCQSALTGGGR